jgi:O-antigen/teichoic acid export membrane protein
VNVLSLPAFYSFLGKGKLKWNVMSNVIAASGMFLFAPLIGHFFPGSAIALSWALPTIAGALFLLFRYKKENHIANRFFINKDLVLVFSSGILVVATVYLLNYLFLHGDISKTLLLAGSILIPLLVSGTLLYSNKTIRKILKRLKYGS